MQLADKANGQATAQHTSATPRVHRGMIGRLKHQAGGRKQGLQVTLNVIKINRTLFATPLRRID
jgi:hypothetical protein